MAKPRIGMARVSLEGTFKADRPFHDPLEAIVLLTEIENRAAVIIALDLCFVSFATSRAIREAIEARTDIRADRIVTHCTHTHTGPWNMQIRGDAVEPLAKRLSEAVLDAQEAAAAAEMAYVDIDLPGVNVNRRKVWGDVGSICVHMGSAPGPDGKADFAAINHARLRHVLGPAHGRANLPDVMPYDGPTDSLLQAVYFRRATDHQPIGSLVRFTAHPATAGHTYSQKQYSADFPGIVRRHLAHAFGGESAFLTGPCGNLLIDEHADWPDVDLPEGDFAYHRLSVPWLAHRDPHNCWREVERQGEALWRPLIDALPEDDAFAPIENAAWSIDQVDVALRDDLPATDEQADERAGALLERFKKLRGEDASDPREVKRLADAVCLNRLTPMKRNWYDAPPGTEAISVDIPLLRLGDVCLLGLQGESFWESAQPAFQAASKRGCKLISFTEANGDMGYLPTTAERPLGDYETYCCLAAEGAVDKVERAAREAVERLAHDTQTP